jgi:hypothetical protein
MAPFSTEELEKAEVISIAKIEIVLFEIWLPSDHFL